MDVADAVRMDGFRLGDASRSEVDRKAAEKEARNFAAKLVPALHITAFLMASMVFPAVPPLVQPLLASVVQFYSGWRSLSGAYKAFRNKTANMNALAALGTTSTFIYSAYAALPREYTFFKVSAAVITLALGTWRPG